MDVKGGAVKWLRVLELRIIKVMQSFLSDIELHTQVYSCQHLQAHCTARISSKPSFNDFISLKGTQNLLTKFAYIFSCTFIQLKVYLVCTNQTTKYSTHYGKIKCNIAECLV